MNRYHKVKRILSERKFSRIFDNNLHTAGVCTIYRSHNEGFINSLQSCKVNGVIYARFQCKRQVGGRLSTYAIRYSEDFPLDYVAFRAYPSHLIKNVVEI